MVSKLSKIIICRYKYLLTRSIVILNTSCKIGNNVRITNSYIEVLKGSTLTIDDNCILANVRMVIKGNVTIGEGNIIDNAGMFKKLLVNIDHGSLIIGTRNRLQCEIKVRYGAILKVGDHNNINEGSEIRSDEKVTIGSFNQISYRCFIWDTNTHNIYPDAQRRELTTDHYPKFGFEFEKPKTLPILIGSDCWIGREVAILKGTTIGDSTIIGFRATLSNCIVENNTTVVPRIVNSTFVRKIDSK
jgi:acetyltransferase-like isoleucine patch superfamily enzyme